MRSLLATFGIAVIFSCALSAAAQTGGVYFPEYAATDYRVTADELHAADARHAHAYRFKTLQKI